MSFINHSSTKFGSINDSQQLRQALMATEDAPPPPAEGTFQVFMRRYGRTMDRHFEVIRLESNLLLLWNLVNFFSIFFVFVESLFKYIISR